jgi:hypothetical protein
MCRRAVRGGCLGSVLGLEESGALSLCDPMMTTNPRLGFFGAAPGFNTSLAFNFANPRITNEFVRIAPGHRTSAARGLSFLFTGSESRPQLL